MGKKNQRESQKNISSPSLLTDIENEETQPIRSSKRLRNSLPKCSNKECCNNCVQTRRNKSVSSNEEEKDIQEPLARRTRSRKSKKVIEGVFPQGISNNITSTKWTYSLAHSVSTSLYSDHPCFKESAQIISPIYNKFITTQSKIYSETTVVSMISSKQSSHEILSLNSYRNYLDSESSLSITESETLESYMDLIDDNNCIESLPENLQDTQVSMALSDLISDYGIRFFVDLYHLDEDIDEKFFDKLLS